MFKVGALLDIGDVFYRWVNFDENPHNKFFILIAKQPKRFFFINSVINPFILRSPELTAQQVELPSLEHIFLSHDSYTDCIGTVDTTEIRNVGDFNTFPENDRRGVVTLSVLNSIYEAIKVNETIDEEIRENIENQLKVAIDLRESNVSSQ